MANFLRTTNRICRIVRLRRTLVNWREKAKLSYSRHGAPSKVPPGHIAVYVGGSSQRFLVRAMYLNHPLFMKLLAKAEEEFGFHHDGPLIIPCDESTFEDVIRAVSGSVRGTRCVKWEVFRPLLKGLDQRLVCKKLVPSMD